MTKGLVDMIALLPQDLSGDDDLRLRIITLATKAAFQWWRPLQMNQDYRLLKDITILLAHYLERQPLCGWRPASREFRSIWQEPEDWEEASWQRIHSTLLLRNRRRFWSLALAYANEANRRNAAVKWLVATLLTIGTVAGGLLIAADKAGLL